MPIVEAKVAKELEAAIMSELGNAFSSDGAPADVAESHKKMAGAIATGVAKVICNMLLTEAQVAPGIAMTGVGGGVPGPVTGATSAPGKLL